MLRIALGSAVLVSALVVLSPRATGKPVNPTAAAAHSTISSYNGSSTCSACHPSVPGHVFGSLHYQWKDTAGRVTNATGPMGKLAGGFTTCAGSVLGSRRFLCSTCHVGSGGAPSETSSPAQLANIDCLICHRETYERKPAGPFEDVSVTDYLSTQHTWSLPVEDGSGSFAFTPDETAMGMTAAAAAQGLELPTRGACLRCHAAADGRDGAKRGDMSSVFADPPRTTDVHMSPAGGDLDCQDCHAFTNHQVLGKSLDLGPSDVTGRVECSSCHGATPHTDEKLNDHVARVACQTCHIPRAAVGWNTELSRNLLSPTFGAGLLGGPGEYSPAATTDTDFAPDHRWYNGTSTVYGTGTVPPQDGDGAYLFAAPNGGVNKTGSKIHPVKAHETTLARHDATGQFIPLNAFTYATTGSFTQAVNDGKTALGLTGATTNVTARSVMDLNHGVVPKESALGCGSCHAAYGSGGAIDFPALGIAPKGDSTAVCGQCHNARPFRGFDTDHSSHVGGKGFDCAWCHSFTRPERGLKLPPDLPVEEDSVAVTKVKLKLGTKKPSSDSLSLSGKLALVNPAQDLTVATTTLEFGTFTVEIAPGGFVKKGTKPVYSYKSPKGVTPAVSLTIDLAKRTFKAAVKAAVIGDQGSPVALRLAFGTYDAATSVTMP